jgi:hypothetical protein
MQSEFCSNRNIFTTEFNVLTAICIDDDIVVFGPPDVVEVLVDIGPTGTRGSQVFVGVGNPNTVEIGQTPLLNDLYINASPGADYGYMYQYVSEPGGNTWIQILEISPKTSK